MGKFNYYTIAALPRLTWDSELPGTLAELLEEFELQFDDLREGISEIVFLNDIKNMEMILKSRLDAAASPDAASEPVEFYRARVAEPEQLELFLDDPLHNAFDGCPEYVVDFFTGHRTNEERYAAIEELYLQYFESLQESGEEYIRYYGRFETMLRTIISAVRLIKADKNLEKELKGDPDAVKTILENRNNADLGLKGLFPEVVDVVALFDGSRDLVEIERELDRIRFALLEDLGGEKPFADHAVYAFVIGLLIRDRWNTLNDERGMEILNSIVRGNF